MWTQGNTLRLPSHRDLAVSPSDEGKDAGVKGLERVSGAAALLAVGQVHVEEVILLASEAKLGGGDADGGVRPTDNRVSDGRCLLKWLAYSTREGKEGAEVHRLRLLEQHDRYQHVRHKRCRPHLDREREPHGKTGG